MYLCAANPEADDAEPGVAGAGPGVPALDADERASAITLARVATLQIINNWRRQIEFIAYSNSQYYS